KTKDEFKVIIRRLPSLMTWKEVEEQLSPLPDHFYRQFSPAHPELFPHSYATCYLGIKGEKEVLEFAERFNRYVFIDSAGNESRAVVEFAPCQKFPKSSKEEIGGDSKISTVDNDPVYLSFLEELEKEDKAHVTIEDQLKEAEEKEKMRLNGNEKLVVTPLVKYFFEQAKNNKETIGSFRRRGDRQMDPFNKSRKPIPAFEKREKDQRPEKNGYEKKFGGRPGSGGNRAREEREKEEDTKKVDSLNPKVRDLMRNGGQRDEKEKKRPPRTRGNEKAKDKFGGIRPERPIYTPGQRKKPEEMES
ncbi:hypothetical protein PENTCL1PPCAC_26459, partial [Pristionchus entomophagus]